MSLTNTKTPRPWDRRELLLLLNLYCRIPFGRQHSKANEVINLAKILGRTPGSVAMKLNNISSLDQKEMERGVSGLSGASRLDREVWNEFQNNWEEMAAASEELWQRAMGSNLVDQCPVGLMEEDVPSSANNNIDLSKTEQHKLVRVRLTQSFFRRAVLTAYDGKCCISENPVPNFLIASHILPWSDFPQERVNPSNGLCLSRLHDAAFDSGLMTIDENYQVVLSKVLYNYLPSESLQKNFISYEGMRIRMPGKFIPNQEYLSYHRNNIFIA